MNEIFNPMFVDFNGKPIVTWRLGHDDSSLRSDSNHLRQYMIWKASKLQKNEPPDAFWQSNGPAIVRALTYCGAVALVLNHVSDRKVNYKWFAPSSLATPRDNWFRLCSVSAEDTSAGPRVHVVLPSDEEVTFVFSSVQMKDWLKSSTPPEVSGSQETASEKQERYRLGEG